MSFLTWALRTCPTAAALDDGGAVLSYQELHEESMETGRALKASGVEKGDVVALVGELDRRFLTTLHGVWCVGGIVAPLNERWTGPEIQRALKVLSPRLILVGKGAGALADADLGFPDLGRFSVAARDSSAYPPLVVPSSTAGSWAGPEAEDPAATLFTSGTSGKPRTVTVTFENLRASAEGARERLDLSGSDRWLSTLSIAHIGGLAMVSRAALLGSTVVLRGRFSADTLVSLIDAGEITHASLVPVMLQRILERWRNRITPASIRCLLVGGASAPEGLVREALDTGLPIALTYGLSEATSQVATAPPALVRRKPGTVGEPLMGVEVRLGDDGELMVKGPTVAPGVAGEGGWLRTGDLARKDEEGHLWITGRKTDRIVTGGVNVDPEEVAKVLESHPGVEEAIVLAQPDPLWGEKIVAVVVSRVNGLALARELEALARGALSPPKRPRAIHVRSGLPRNPNGKVDKERLRALLR